MGRGEMGRGGEEYMEDVEGKSRNGIMITFMVIDLEIYSIPGIFFPKIRIFHIFRTYKGFHFISWIHIANALSSLNLQINVHNLTFIQTLNCSKLVQSLLSVQP